MLLELLKQLQEKVDQLEAIAFEQKAKLDALKKLLGNMPAQHVPSEKKDG